jgi:hypothetical protein
MMKNKYKNNILNINNTYKMDVLYYSQFCKHSQKILQYLVKNNLVSKINCICIDKREKNPANNTINIILENGKRIILPSEITAVPSLISQNQIISGDEIIAYYNPVIQNNLNVAQRNNGEPVSYSLGSYSGVSSEKYTDYKLNPVDLSSKGINRDLNGYVSANHIINKIPTPENNYKPDKVSNDVNINKLQEIRNKDIPQNHTNSLQINNSNLLT